MNVSPSVAAALNRAGHDALHWFDVGVPGAPDTEIMAWAQHNGRVVITHDLDFGDLLAATGAHGPSVIQVRAGKLVTDELAALLLAALGGLAADLDRGALVSLDTRRRRVRLLPIRPLIEDDLGELP